MQYDWRSMYVPDHSFEVRIKIVIEIFCVSTSQPQNILNLIFIINFSNKFYYLTPRFIKSWNYVSEHDVVPATKKC